jgi:hypothetical protein
MGCVIPDTSFPAIPLLINSQRHLVKVPFSTYFFMLESDSGRVNRYRNNRGGTIMNPDYEKCIQACIECMEACNSCYDACLLEDNVKMMADCIRMDRECADMCAFAVQSMQRNSPFAEQVCTLCAEVCQACGEICRQHEAKHCQDCADVCFACADACRTMAA